MAAPRKDEERARLYAAALQLFSEKGYIATSYKDIADACKTSKSVVQHYYPRKEMLLALYLDEHFNWVRKTARELCPPHADTIEILCMMGFVHFGKLAADGQMSPLVQDLLGFRTFIEGVVLRERDWIIKRIPGNFDRGFVADSLVAALNGAYGFLASASLEDRMIDPAYLMRLVFAPFSIALGTSPERVNEVIEECSLLQAVQ